MKELKSIIINPFQLSVAFHIETSLDLQWKLYDWFLYERIYVIKELKS